jgi:hypothetical protein
LFKDVLIKLGQNLYNDITEIKLSASGREVLQVPIYALCLYKLSQYTAILKFNGQEAIHLAYSQSGLQIEI